MKEDEVQWRLIYVPGNNVEPHITIIVSMNDTKKIRDLKELILKSLQKENLVLSRIAIATVRDNRIIAVLEDDEQLQKIAKGYGFYRTSLFAFEIKSPPSGYKCVDCLRECDYERTEHDLNGCSFFMSDICMRNYFKKDPKFHLCPLCYEKVTASSFTKFNGLFSYVKLVNVPILLRHDTINKQISPDQKSLILFGYPRFLKLPTDVCATDLFELVTQVVPQGEYSLHKGRSQDFKCGKYNCKVIQCTGCKIPATGLVNVYECAIYVNYTNIPTISPPIPHSIAHCDTSQRISETNNPSMQNLFVNKLNPFENKVTEENKDLRMNDAISSKNATLQKTFDKDEDPKVDDPHLSNAHLTVIDPKITVSVWPKINIDREENSPVIENSKINVPTWMSDDFPELQTTANKDGDSEIGASDLPSKTLANSLNTSITQTKIWEDYFGFQYEINETDGKKYYKCTTEKVWSLCPNQNGEQPFKIPYFRDLSIGKSFKSIYVDINGNPVDYKILGPITVSEQCGNELIIRTYASFRSSHYFVSGQVLFTKSDDFFTPCGIITCSVREENEYRYIISNYKQYTVCLSCEDEIKEIPFNEIQSSIAKDEDFDVCYWEQRVENEERILRYLNSNFEVVYTCCDNAIEEYDPMGFVWHWLRG